MMSPTELLAFGTFLLDFANECVWCDDEPLALTLKAFALLGYLVQHPNRLITKAELFTAVWPGIVVSDWALATCIREIRRVLGDSAKTPHIIETVYRRGYRFLPTVTAITGSHPKLHPPRGQAGEQPLPDESQTASFGSRNQEHEILLVGRDTELVQLHNLFKKALAGERQIVFVTGEPGIGKTTLVDAFLQRLDSQRQTLGAGVQIVRGQCIEQYGQGEAYLPMLEALGRLGRSAAGSTLKAVLEQYAPTWLLHLPALVTAEEALALQPRVFGVMQDRMLRELAEALEVLTATQPLILVFEDLHWADASTLMLLSALAHRREAARLLILGTFRSTEATPAGSPLARLLRDLAEHHLSQEIAVSLLDANAIAAYLTARFPLRLFPTRFPALLYQRTEGNPLFVVSLLQDLLARGIVTQSESTWTFNGDVDTVLHETPGEIRQFVLNQGTRLHPKSHRVLEAASVAGLEFAAAEVAAALETTVAEVEEQCAGLAGQQQFLRRAGVGEWPDHTLSARYTFLHAVYQTVWHEQVSPTRLQEWHRRIGNRKEAAYGERAGEIAAELAMHFEQGRAYQRAVHYLEQAAQNALKRLANQEAISLLTRALDLLKTLPDTPERARQELQVQVALGAPLVMTKGYAAPEVKSAYDRARDLSWQMGESPHLFPVLLGLTRFYVIQADFHSASELGEEMLRLAYRAQDAKLILGAQMLLSAKCFFQGEFAQAQRYAEHGLALFDAQQHQALIFLYGENPQVMCSCWAALALWYLGYPDQAQGRISHALRLAQEFAHPYDLTSTLFWAAFLHHCRREIQRAGEQLEVLLPLTREHRIPHTEALGTGLWGSVLSEQGQREEGMAQIQQSMVATHALGHVMGRPYFLTLLAEASSKAGQVAEGTQMLTEALKLGQSTGEGMQLAEIYRLKGELTLQSKVQGPKSEVQEAEECFHTAIDIARKQHAKSLELRAAVSLARLWQQQGKQKDAHQLLSEVYNWFTEGFETKDLQEAKAVLDDLAANFP
jgi:DNA-binding winged helix-turn-helix (wHTH) protein/predicted ATPase